MATATFKADELHDIDALIQAFMQNDTSTDINPRLVCWIPRIQRTTSLSMSKALAGFATHRSG